MLDVDTQRALDNFTAIHDDIKRLSELYQNHLKLCKQQGTEPQWNSLQEFISYAHRL